MINSFIVQLTNTNIDENIILWNHLNLLIPLISEIIFLIVFGIIINRMINKKEKKDSKIDLIVEKFKDKYESLSKESYYSYNLIIKGYKSGSQTITGIINKVVNEYNELLSYYNQYSLVLKDYSHHFENIKIEGKEYINLLIEKKFGEANKQYEKFNSSLTEINNIYLK